MHKVLHKSGDSARNAWASARRLARSGYSKATVAVGAAGASVLAPVAAFAATDPGTAITTEITSAKTTVEGILVILAGIVGLFILWSYLKKAR